MEQNHVMFLTLTVTCLFGGVFMDEASIGNIAALDLQDSLQHIFNPIDVVDEHISNEKAKNHSVCKAYLEEYAEQSSRFTKCLVENARPFRFCETCVVPYTKAATVYKHMVANKACSEVLLNADRVQVVRLISENMKNIWNSAYCSDCFANVSEDVNGTVNSSLSEDTYHFVDLFFNISTCLNLTTQEFDPLMVNPGNTSLCIKCRADYMAINEHYTFMLRHSQSHVCMDVVDMMNYTRLIWSKRLFCSQRKGHMAPVLVITAIACTLPVIFYVSNRLVKPKTERTIVIQRRLKFPRTSSNYGSMSGSIRTLDTSNSQSVDSSSNNLIRS